MSMPEYIRSNIEPLVSEWAAFAASLYPTEESLETEGLRDFARELLRMVADDMVASQSEEERVQKSRGERPLHAPGLTESAVVHASGRLTQGFSLPQIVAEYRALRATVVSHWCGGLQNPGRGELNELTRFNEAIDELLTEAIGAYTDQVEHARDLYTGMLAHDLRTPLAAILSSTEALLRCDELDHHHTKAAARIRNSSLRMRGMIGDLLDFTRTRLGAGLPISVKPVDLSLPVRSTLDELRALNPQRILHQDFSGDLTGTWDSVRIEQLVSNLVSNALHYGYKDAPITVSVCGTAEEVYLSVHNEGAAIPADTQRVLFDPLTRGAAQEREGHPASEGMGLGLYIARQIAETHGGSIGVESPEGMGTTFRVTLPRRSRSGTDTYALN